MNLTISKTKYDGRRCINLRKDGLQCKNFRQYGNEYCWNHREDPLNDANRCKGLTKKMFRCKRVGKVYCSSHQDQDWTGKGCITCVNKEYTFPRIRISPESCDVHTDKNASYWIVKYYGGTHSLTCNALNSHFVGIGIFTSLSDVENVINVQIEDIVPNQVKGATISRVISQEEDIKYFHLLTKTISSLKINELITIVNDFIGRNYIMIECINGISSWNSCIIVNQTIQDSEKNPIYCIETNKVYKLPDIISNQIIF
uniref:Zn-finger protein n=1 Tax=Pithovirus LCPAC403 TaxID=2506596 RepID=A0A481ZB04_9VIRU|nr:MAG: Zn-finger protein [Pithovirus LCPAC403]